MRLKGVRAVAFRNLEDTTFQPGPAISILFGENAQGKTNLIEAVYLASNLQSFRTHRIRDLVSSGSREAYLEARVQSRLGVSSLEIHLASSGKTALINGSKPRTSSAYLSEFRTVLFSPSDLELVRGSQSLRRRFLDRATYLADDRHLAGLRHFSRVLQQRNALLRSGAAGLEIWDEAYSLAAASVRGSRQTVVRRLSPVITELHNEISGSREQSEIVIGSWGSADASSPDAVLNELQRSAARDRRVGFTTVGPHRDRIRLSLNGKDVEKQASQGQLRTLALSMKLSLLRFALDEVGEEPVFLLDDPGSELDERRLGYLGDFLSNWSGQVIIAGTNPKCVPISARDNTEYFLVNDGVICPVTP